MRPTHEVNPVKVLCGGYMELASAENRDIHKSKRFAGNL
jgi:hypothetical protein